MRFVWAITEDVNQMKRPPIDEVAGNEFAAFRFGVADPSTHVLLHNLIQVETDSA